VDVLAINRREKAISLEECEWWRDALRRTMISELVARTGR